MNKRRIALALIAMALAGGTWVTVHAAGSAVTLVAPHRVVPPRATLSAEFVADVDEAAKGVTSTDDAVRASLRLTSRSLRFGLGHRARYHFDRPEREAHCAEYSQLYAAVFRRLAVKAKLSARPIVYRSDARLFGRRFEDPAWRDHDWVLITDPHSHKRWYVDPSFADTGLGWDVRDNVIGLRF